MALVANAMGDHAGQSLTSDSRDQCKCDEADKAMNESGPPPRLRRGDPPIAIPAFIIGLLGIMLLVHFLVPETEEHLSSSKSPTHQKK